MLTVHGCEHDLRSGSSGACSTLWCALVHLRQEAKGLPRVPEFDPCSLFKQGPGS